jgi:cell division protein FtsL
MLANVWTDILWIWDAVLPEWLCGKQQSTAAALPRRYMPGAPEIYFRKEIDNSRLVRTEDPVVKREMRLFAGTLAVCLLMLLAYLGQHCRSIEYGYEIESLRSECQKANDVNRTLKLEAATLKDPQRIDTLASRMGLALPAVGQVEHLDPSGNTGAPVLARADTFSVISVPN